MTVTSKKDSIENAASLDLPSLLLKVLNERSTFDSDVLAAELDVKHQQLIGAVKSLQTTEGLIDVESVEQRKLELTKEGLFIVENGSHEFNVYEKVGADGATADELKALPFGNVGISKALQNKWIRKEESAKDAKLPLRYRQQERSGGEEPVRDETRQHLTELSSAPSAKIAELKKRKLISEIVTKISRVKKGAAFKPTIDRPEVDLTADMVLSGAWRQKTFKKYNFAALGAAPPSGHLHPLLKVRSEFRDIFFQMGFTEMPTNRYVESSFWNFDALFQPQQHPARDSHDTFFVSDPATSTKFPADYLKRVKEVHENGGDCDSMGYEYDWDIAEAQKNVLRTHTTAVSARQLYKFAQTDGARPLKMFSIDRVYRNETLDATHLAEFHQVEGVIAEKNLSLAHVIGLFTEFYRKCGLTNLRFKPTYNPYTEPSMEIFAFHEGLNKWVEIGNSGMFRPEMLLPMGFSADVNVAGFGLSLERPTMIRYGISNIREMFGHKIDLNMVYKNPILRLS